MARKLIVVGDPTDHHGTVLTGSPMHRIGGKAIARLGDEVDCPSHGKNPIVEGESSLTIDGVPVALEGHKTKCGCVLIGTVSVTHG